jgi:hypothetical protein
VVTMCPVLIVDAGTCRQACPLAPASTNRASNPVSRGLPQGRAIRKSNVVTKPFGSTMKCSHPHR